MHEYALVLDRRQLHALVIGANHVKGNLLPHLSDLSGFNVEHWLTMHEDLKTTKRVRLLFDFLAGALTAFWSAPTKAR